jgi:hypothetical protein
MSPGAAFCSIGPSDVTAIRSDLVRASS